ncbi:MAG: class II aldolase/adducin family protein [Gammaproteobacteria bacterium]|jgi:ribulose-5-phosphate 4-epimerase/fuculose-1-phosphate aldolase
MQEGVIKFELRHRKTATLTIREGLPALTAWRQILWQLRLVGQDPPRYGGYGFGNVSMRLAPFAAPFNRRRFLISGTQTGSLPVLDASHYVAVTEYDPRQNRVVSAGPLPPSSESLTHGMLYNMAAAIHVILHVHSPDIWQAATGLGIPVTDAAVAYGTPEMADEVGRLFAETDVRHRGLFAMGGHRDGIVAFGANADQAGQIVVQALAASLALRAG